MKLLKFYSKTYTKLFLFMVMFGSSLSAMDVSTYYDVDIKSIQISIEGSKKVLKLLRSGASIQEQYSVDDEIQKKLQGLFRSVNSTPSKHAGFYMKHRKEVEAYYENNMTLQEMYKNLKNELESTNKTIKAIRGAGK